MDKGESFAAGVVLGLLVVLLAIMACTTTGIPKAQNVGPGDWVWVGDQFTHTCCSCGLTHHVTIVKALHSGYYMQWVKDDRRTRSWQRHMLFLEPFHGKAVRTLRD